MRRQAAILLLLILVLAVACSAGSQPIQLTAVTWSGGRNLDAEREIYEAFNKTQEAIRLELNQVPGGFAAFAEKVTLMMLGGSPPDLTLTHMDFHTQWANAGLVLELEPFMARHPIDLNQLPPGSTETYRNASGSLTGVPLYLSSTVLTFNKSLFDQSGLGYPTEQWAIQKDFLEAARVLTRDINGDGSPDIWGIAPFRVTGFFWRLWGLRYVDPNLERFALNTAQGAEAFQFMRDLVCTWRVAPGLWSSGGWVRGTVGMTAPNQVEALFNSNGLTDQWDVAHLPVGPSGRRVTRAATFGIAIPTGVPHPEAAWEVVRYLISREVQERLLESGRGGIRIDVVARYYERMDPAKGGLSFAPGSFQNRRVMVDSFAYADFEHLAGLTLPSTAGFRSVLENCQIPLSQVLADLEVIVNKELRER